MDDLVDQMEARDARDKAVALAEHVLRAQAGDAESLTWLVVYFSPLLHAQARYRLRGGLQNECDADDLVDETWAVVLPRLGDVRAEPALLGRALVGFLSTTLLHKVLNLRERRRRRPGVAGVPTGPPSSVLASFADRLG